MRSNFAILGSVAILSLGLSACGTIMNGGSQTVDVVVKGSPSAFCEFTTSVFKNAATFPNKMIVERSRENLVAECRGEQNKYVKFEIPSVLTASGSVGNVATGVVPGAAYDAASGGMWAYPDPIIVDFRKDYSKADAKPAWPGETVDDQIDATRIGTANIAAPKPIRMQPVLDEQLNPALPATHAPMAKTEVIDAVRLATDKQPAAVKVETTTTTTATTTPTKITPMKPIISPEDDPAVQKAKAEAKAKAAAEAKRKAEAKKKAAAEAAAKKAAEEEAAAKAEAEAKAAADAAAEATTTTTTTTTVTTEPAPTGLTTPPTTSDASASSTTTTTTTTSTEPAPTTPEPPKDGESVDEIEYLKN